MAVRGRGLGKRNFLILEGGHGLNRRCLLAVKRAGEVIT